jgi:hypothetical protein
MDRADDLRDGLARGRPRPARLLADLAWLTPPLRRRKALHDEGLPKALSTHADGALAALIEGRLDPYVPECMFEGIDVPALFATGWCDTFALPLAALGAAWRAGAAGLRSRSHVGPWSHSNTLPMNVGQVSFDAAAAGGIWGMARQHARFFAAEFDGVERGVEPSAEHVLFVDRWYDADAPSTSELSLDLVPVAGSADIRLQGEADLTPTLGCQSHFNTGGVPGPIDQRPLLRRANSALLLSQSLSEPIEPGLLRLRLGACDASQSTLVAKLCLIDPD